MGIEQREYTRLDQEFVVFFDVVQNSLQKPVEFPRRKGTAKNISGGGLYFVPSRMYKRIVKKLLGHFNKLSMEFNLPDFQNKVRVLGEVRWVKGKLQWWNILARHWELGVRFVYIRPEDRDSIIKYIINKQIEDHLAKT